MKRVALIGQPNCGKSALFNSIAGYKANSSHFPGTTVEILTSEVVYKEENFELIDLPGSYSLSPFDKAEEVNTLFVLKEDFDLIINVMDASILSRSLELSIEILDIGKPVIIALNMMDEAKKKGIHIDIEKLSSILGVPVVPTIALYGEGVNNLLKEVIKMLKKPIKPKPIKLNSTIEAVISNLVKFFPDREEKRFLVYKGIEWNLIKEKIEIPHSFFEEISKINQEIERVYGKDLKEFIFSERHHLSMKIAEEVTIVKHSIEKSLEERIDKILYHPFWGYIIFVSSFVFVLLLVFKIGGLLEDIFVFPFDILSAKFQSIKTYKFLKPLISGTLDGTMGAIGVIVPFMVPLLFFISLFEETGFLARSAFLFDSFMHKIGLHGKSIPPLILGFGCNVPAISATRIIESERDRIITALLIPFIPCSARTIVISALVSKYLGVWWALFIYLISIIITIIISLLASSFLKYPAPGLIMEIPSFKAPNIKNVLMKTWVQLKPFLYFAVPILVLGSIFIEYFKLYGAENIINSILRPITYILNLPPQVGFTLIFGFLRKELALLMLGQSLGVRITEINSVLSPLQILSFTLFTTLYVPCLATLLILKREFNSKIAIISLFLNIGTALLITTFIMWVLKGVGV